ncbi:MAG: hypothetical protein QGH26_05720, partial [Candidatus Pacebacteria bacterium]|nr:hypothetical protein [Candidatus Paceibacterota bacterium]
KFSHGFTQVGTDVRNKEKDKRQDAPVRQFVRRAKHLSFDFLLHIYFTPRPLPLQLHIELPHIKRNQVVNLRCRTPLQLTLFTAKRPESEKS